MENTSIREFVGGLGIGQRWLDGHGPAVLRIVTIDPALHTVEVEDLAGRVECDTIEHFLSTHRAEAC